MKELGIKQILVFFILNIFSCILYGQNYDTSNEINIINGVSVPSDFPVFTPEINLLDNQSGKIFISNLMGNPYLLILNNDGSPFYYKKLLNSTLDFKLQSNGLITYNMPGNANGFYAMNTNFEIVDSFKCTDNFITDGHEITMLSDGGYFLIANGNRHFNMAQIIPDGNPDAILYDTHIQEFDSDHNLIFEWLCYQHYEITDVQAIDLTSKSIDWVHINSIAVDYDDNIIISARSLDEVTKINRTTGEIIWRLGGKKSSFTFANNDPGLSSQHDARPVPGKPNHYTIFDNGNNHSPQYSRCVEYKIDTLNWTATKVWEYRSNPDIFSGKMGSAQRLENGNTLLNWVGESMPKAMEVTEDGTIVYLGNFEKPSTAYRSYRFDFNGIANVPYLITENSSENVKLIFNHFGDSSIVNYIVFAGQSVSDLMAIDTTSNPYYVANNFNNYQKYYFAVKSINQNGNESPFSNIDSAFIRITDPGENLIINGTFENELAYWQYELSEDSRVNTYINDIGECVIEVLDNAVSSDIILFQSDIPLTTDKEYILEFTAKANESRIISPRVESTNNPIIIYSKIGYVALTSQYKNYSYKFKMENSSDPNARLIFDFSNTQGTIYLDNVSLKENNVTEVNNTKSNINEFTLSQNFPNPFNPTTTIKYTIAFVETGHAPSLRTALKIYDILGREVAVLVNEYQKPGNYNIDFNANNLNSGVYFYKLTVGNNSITKKMLFLK